MSIEDRLDEIEARLAALEASKPGPKARPILVSADGVCGLDPTRDSTTCPYASLYRRNHGCQGQACKWKATAYYRNRRVEQKHSAQ